MFSQIEINFSTADCRNEMSSRKASAKWRKKIFHHDDSCRRRLVEWPKKKVVRKLKNLVESLSSEKLMLNYIAECCAAAAGEQLNCLQFFIFILSFKLFRWARLAGIRIQSEISSTWHNHLKLSIVNKINEQKSSKSTQAILTVLVDN